MRECLKCKKDISEKHESAKFCSTSCRVMWNRKHGKKDEIKPFQMQVLYNQLLEAVNKIGQVNNLPPIMGAVVQIKEPIKKSIWDEQPKQPEFKSAMDYKAEKRELETEDDYNDWLKRLKADPNITNKEKELLIKFN